VAAQNPFAQAASAALLNWPFFKRVMPCTPALSALSGHDHCAPLALLPKLPGRCCHGVLKFTFQQWVFALDAARASSLVHIQNGEAKKNGVAVARPLPPRMIALRATMGSAPPKTFLPSSTDPGLWHQRLPLWPGNLAELGERDSNSASAAASNSAQSRRLRLPAADTKVLQGGAAVGDVNSAQRPEDRSEVAVFRCSHRALRLEFRHSAGKLRQAHPSAKPHAFALVNMALSDSLFPSWKPSIFMSVGVPSRDPCRRDRDDNPRNRSGFLALRHLVPLPRSPVIRRPTLGEVTLAER